MDHIFCYPTKDTQARLVFSSLPKTKMSDFQVKLHFYKIWYVIGQRDTWFFKGMSKHISQMHFLCYFEITCDIF